MHPDEQTLLEYVDGARDPEVARHVDECAQCSAQLRLLEAGRDALRTAPLLELPPDRRKAIVAALPERHDRWSPLRGRFAPAAAAAAALVLVAGVVALATLVGGDGGRGNQEGGGAGGGGGGGGGAAETAQADQGAGTTRSSKQTLSQAYGTPVRRVQGPVEAVIRRLQRNGIATFRRDGSVLAKADRDNVIGALAGRPDGRVAVYVR